jgi:hypothetical protein
MTGCGGLGRNCWSWRWWASRSSPTGSGPRRSAISTRRCATRPPSRATSSRCASSSPRFLISAASRSRSPAAAGRTPRWPRWFRWRVAGCASWTRS